MDRALVFALTTGLGPLQIQHPQLTDLGEMISSRE